MRAAQSNRRSGYETVAECPGVLRVTAWENVVLCVWSGQATGQAAHVVLTSMDRPGAAGRRSSYVHIIRDQLALPDADARTGFTQLLRKRHAELGCVAIVVGGTGFWASAMRNAVIGLRLLGPRDFEFRLYGTADELVEWLPAAHQRLTGVSIAPVTLRQLLSTAQET